MKFSKNNTLAMKGHYNLLINLDNIDGEPVINHVDFFNDEISLYGRAIAIASRYFKYLSKEELEEIKALISRFSEATKDKLNKDTNIDIIRNIMDEFAEIIASQTYLTWYNLAHSNTSVQDLIDMSNNMIMELLHYRHKNG